MGKRNKMKIWKLTKAIYSYKDKEPNSTFEFDRFKINKNEGLYIYTKDLKNYFIIKNENSGDCNKTIYRVIIKDNIRYIELFISKDKLNIIDIKNIDSSNKILDYFQNMYKILNKITKDYLKESIEKEELKKRLTKELLEV